MKIFDYKKNRVGPVLLMSTKQQPLVLSNIPHANAVIYFSDPDGNSLELITPLKLDDVESFDEMSLEEWRKNYSL
ncbi:VOC family protein [Lysinibacillus sp. NPDC086135]|uniref:VOC family protein n=1 Tax=Lysinibacillus sp. NPDC086135 TaxID=3364130 RepID=UPI00381C5462